MSASKLNTILADPALRAKLEKRFWSKVDRRGPDECWPWISKAKHKHGYGMLAVATGYVDYSHRIAFGLANGGIEDDAHIRHDCDYPACCNDRHLRDGTQADNVKDMMDRGRHRPAEMTAELRKKIGETRKANHAAGKHQQSLRQREAVRETLRKRWADPEWRKRWTENMSGEKNPTFGRTFKHTDEARRKIAAAGTGRKHSEETKAKIRAIAADREAKKREQRE